MSRRFRRYLSEFWSPLLLAGLAVISKTEFSANVTLVNRDYISISHSEHHNHVLDGVVVACELLPKHPRPLTCADTSCSSARLLQSRQNVEDLGSSPCLGDSFLHLRDYYLKDL